MTVTTAMASAQTGSEAPACTGTTGYAGSFGGRRTFLWRPDWLESRKADFDAGGRAEPAFVALLARANTALDAPAYTVTDKLQKPASGDPHDYLSIGPYWWPDPARPNGLPYVRRDGQVNPERASNAFDVTDLSNLSADVHSLGLAYYFTADERYARKAATLLRVWFLDPTTRMNPNLNHAQAVPGRFSGRAEGVIDAARLVPVVESIGLLSVSPALSDLEQIGLRTWFEDLVDWMATSPIGLEERAAENNHGIYYDMLISQFALFAGRDDIARNITAAFGQRRIDAQFAADGSLPRELVRTRSLHYSTWTLAAVFNVADLARCVGVDLWRYEGPEGQSLRVATDFLAPYAGRTGDWPWPEIDKDQTLHLHEVLNRAAWAWQDPSHIRAADTYARKHASDPLTLRLTRFNTLKRRSADGTPE